MTSRLLSAVLFVTIAIAGCASGDDANIESTVDELVDALNDRDRIAAGTLFTNATIEPVNAAGDSSVVYRLITIPGGSDFEASGLQTSVIADRAQATFDLAGRVERSDEVIGEMTIRVGLDLERKGEGWQIVSGSDRMLSTY
ncbi:MAG: hypothetical protein H7X80_07410 [bacterium]|nr:hypothetical protein [Candidatus Kapabacteria bacterium]